MVARECTVLACCSLFDWRCVGLCYVCLSSPVRLVAYALLIASTNQQFIKSFVVWCSGLTPKGMQPFSWPTGASATDEVVRHHQRRDLQLRIHQLAELYGIHLTTGSLRTSTRTYIRQELN